MKKKLLSILLIVVIVFNFILCNSVYADPDNGGLDNLERYGGSGTISPDAAQGLVDSGKSSDGTDMNHKNFGDAIVGVLFQYLALIIDFVPMVIQGAMSIFTANPESGGEVGFGSGLKAIFGSAADHFTIEKTVFNEIAIFNVNVFNQDESITTTIGTHSNTVYQHNINLSLKESVAGWFYTIRLLACMINLCVLIYVGIRMALTTLASEQAKYKKMLIWWAESMIVLFFLHYIMYIMFYLEEFVVNIICLMKYDMIDNEQAVSFESIIINSINQAFFTKSGMNFFIYSLFYWFLTALHIKFFLAYLKRMFTIFFLVIISPLITVTYPIDKLGNGRAEVYDAWFKEIVLNIAIQPIHAIIYLIFVYTAGKIAEKAPWVAMIFLLSLGRVENIVRNIFKITDSVDNINMARKGGGGKAGGLASIGRMFFRKG